MTECVEENKIQVFDLKEGSIVDLLFNRFPELAYLEEKRDEQLIFILPSRKNSFNGEILSLRISESDILVRDSVFIFNGSFMESFHYFPSHPEYGKKYKLLEKVGFY